MHIRHREISGVYASNISPYQFKFAALSIGFGSAISKRSGVNYTASKYLIEEIFKSK